MSADRDPDAPPAGGFGRRGSGERFGPIADAPKPPLSSAQRVFGAAMTFLGVGALVLVGMMVLAMLFVGIRYAKRKPVDVRRAESFNTLGEIGKRAQSTFAERGALCPSARSPVPSDPGWSCLGIETPASKAYRYDYESDHTKFSATATPIDGKDTTVREIRGVVVNEKLVVDSSIRER